MVSRLLFLVAVAGIAWAQPQSSIGRTPTPEEIKRWDVSVFPDGRELPPGGGTAAEGAEVYRLRCEECHGPEAKGADQAALVGGHDTLAGDKPKKTTVGYWPYATTIFDYVRRSMPFKKPGSLTDDQVYAVVAYLLSLDGVIESDARMDRDSLPEVRLPNRDGFVPDPRPKGRKR